MSAAGFTVLGASGFIGGALVRYLQEQGYGVRAVKRHDHGDGLPLDEPLGHVIYAIGVTADFRTRPFDTMEAHVAQVLKLLRQGTFASLTYLSSTRVYEGNQHTNEDAAISVSPASPSALYNISKIAGESVCLNSGHPAVRIVRLSNVIGGDGKQDSFLDQLLREGQGNGAIALRSHPDSAKDYIALDDALGLIAAISERGRHAIYNVASGVQTSHRQVLDVISRQAGWPISVDAGAPHTDFPPIDVSRITTEFGFVPAPFTAYFSDHIKRTLQSRKDQQ
ncbi:MAG: hypothetical protein BGP04_09010 [Rhizobiales bacterium 62-17]|nr:NAD(P)-dependent oxidoreductase [Hyphomicrobiales bacterium]OJY05507.1 MAG: hypothetical protein BGP04_09010 [Rhizobiales bacterium 62-17]